MSVNKVILVGNLGRDPEIRYSPNGAPVCNLSVATSRTWTKDGQRNDETEWHRVVMFNKLAEISGQYLTSGKTVYIEGRLQTRKWQDKGGQDRWSTEVIADQMRMIGGRDDGQRNAPSNNASGGARRTNSPPNFDDDGDDIPY